MKLALNRHSPLVLRQTLSKNRIVIPPMASETADSEGFVTDKTIQHYKRLGLAQSGILMVEYTYVHLSGRSESQQLGIDSDQKIAGLKKLATAIKEAGSLAGIQLTHAGGKTERTFTQGVLMSASNIPVPVKDKIMEAPEAMTKEEILFWKKSFLESSRRAVKAGFELIELHAAHGYGINQWLSPITNKRNDEYGGNLKNNSRLLLEIIQEIRSEFPKIILAVRMPGQDFLESGLTQSDCQEIAIMLESNGVDLIDVSSGIGGWRRPRDRTGEGYLIEEAAAIQRKISLPVIGVGGIESGNYIDKILNQNKVNLTAVGRAILKDPLSWGREQMGVNL